MSARPIGLISMGSGVAAVWMATRIDRYGQARWRLGGRRIGSLCAFRHVTGHRCPGCGMTRATTLLVHGHPIRATRLNPLVWLLIACGVVVRG